MFCSRITRDHAQPGPPRAHAQPNKAAVIVNGAWRHPAESCSSVIGPRGAQPVHHPVGGHAIAQEVPERPAEAPQQTKTSRPPLRRFTAYLRTDSDSAGPGKPTLWTTPQAWTCGR